MFQPTKASALQTVVGIKAGNEGVKASSSASRPAGPMTIAIEGEGGFTYLHKMMAQGGLAGTGENVTNTHPQIPINLFPMCPSLACEIQKHVSILFAIQAAAAANVPATEVVVPEGIAQNS